MGPTLVDDMLRDIAPRRCEILEDFSRAYIAETGLHPSEIQLCQQYDHVSGKYMWWFERKATLTPPTDAKGEE